MHTTHVVNVTEHPRNREYLGSKLFMKVAAGYLVYLVPESCPHEVLFDMRRLSVP